MPVNLPYQFVSIDSGVKALGWAVLRESEVSYYLAMCGLVQGDSRDEMIRAMECALGVGNFELAVLESMVWRPNDPKSHPNDLIDVQTTGCLCAARIADHVKLVTAQTWKGSVPKKIHHERIRSRLSTNETEILNQALADAPKKHHKEILDAVGIGLHHVGRIGR